MSPVIDHHRFGCGAGLTAWLYRYRDTPPRTKRGMASGLEVTVQLSGAWRQRGRWAPTPQAEESFAVLSPGELYDLAFDRPPVGGGLQFGCIAYPEEWSTPLPAGPLRVHAVDPPLRRRYVDLAHAAVHDPGEEPISELGLGSDLLALVRETIERCAEIGPVDNLASARRMIESDFTSPLYLEHFAQEAGMNPVTFLRRFRGRYGLTPVQYRLRLRLNRAARLSWECPDLRSGALAEAVGIETVGFLHRSFLKHFGTSIGEYRLRARRAEDRARSEECDPRVARSG